MFTNTIYKERERKISVLDQVVAAGRAQAGHEAMATASHYKGNEKHSKRGAGKKGHKISNAGHNYTM